MADLDGWGILYFNAEEKEVQETDLTKNRLIFIHTDLGHNEVISLRKQFYRFLASSALKSISEKQKQ